ncbi:MAG TPA: ABC transporter permease [Gemmatimonadaceae bacterium]|nr:ABC transporter permease [Gemmatimonadaceae bacterium]
MTRLELAIAWRYLRSRSASRLLNFISVIAIGGVLVGVSALIVIIGVMNGLQNDLREKILVASPDIRVLTYGEDLTMPDWRGVLDKVSKQPGVVSAAPFVLTQGGVSAGHQYGEGAMVVGIEPAGRGVAEPTSIREHAVPGAGDFSFKTSSGDRTGAVLGKKLAERLNVFPGDSITMVAFAGLKFNPAVGGYIPQLAKYEVTGLFETGMYEYDNSYVFLSLDNAQAFAGLGTAVTGLEVKTKDRWTARETANELREALGSYRVVDWQEQNSSLFQALKLEKFAMGVILLLIVIVAAFNIVSTLTMVVRDKTREIGILRAMGMPARSISRIFQIQGTVIGLVGTVIGLVLGLGTAVAIDRYRLIELDASVYFIDHLPVRVQALDVIWIVLASVVIAVVATVYPARQAARLYPVDAIRAE